MAPGVNAAGYREVLRVQVVSAKDGAGWLAFFRDRNACGLAGVLMLISNAARRADSSDRGSVIGLVGAVLAEQRSNVGTCRSSGEDQIQYVSGRDPHSWP